MFLSEKVTTEDDVSPSVSEAFSGELLANHTYAWLVIAITRTSVLDDGATASGDISLTLSPSTFVGPDATSAVPEPVSMFLWALGALGCGAWVRRGKKA